VVDDAADEPFLIEIDRAYVGGDAELDFRSGLTRVIVQADQLSQIADERVDDASGRDAGRDDDKDAVPPVFVEAVFPRDVGLAEGGHDHSIERPVQKTPDVIITVRTCETVNVHTDHGADLPVQRRQRRAARGANHRCLAEADRQSRKDPLGRVAILRPEITPGLPLPLGVLDPLMSCNVGLLAVLTSEGRPRSRGIGSNAAVVTGAVFRYLGNFGQSRAAQRQSDEPVEQNISPAAWTGQVTNMCTCRKSDILKVFLV
jgi:hypothetical protein